MRPGHNGESDAMRTRDLLLGLLAVAAVAASGASAREGPPLVRVAFGSCADQKLPQPIWHAVLDYRPELFIFAGDNVYGDVASGAMTELQQAYRRARGIDGYRAVRAQVPTLAVWDDHDYGVNDGGADFPHKEAAKALFLDFWDVPASDPRREREGIYHAETFGPEDMRVQVILIDTRWFRSPLMTAVEGVAPGKGRYVPDSDPAKTMLGDAQWRWLEERLEEPAELRLIVSSIQVLAGGHGWERWGNLPHERERLIGLIAETGAEGVLFLSGDRHVGGLYRRRHGVPYDLYEITSSSLNRPFTDPDEAGPLRLGALYGRENFGTVDIDWWAEEVTLAIRGLNGEPVRMVTIPMGDLRPGRG